MIKVTTNDGEVFIGEDEVEIIHQMKRDQWLQYDFKRSYKIDVRGRVETMTGKRIRLDPKGFIADLSQLGLVSVGRAD